MKKIIAVLLAIVLVLSIGVLAACNKDTDDPTNNQNQSTEKPAETKKNTKAGDISEADYASMTADDLLAKIADKDHVTADEYVALVSTLRFAPIKDDANNREIKIDKNITTDAIKAISDSAKPDVSTYFKTLLESEYPQVRAQAYEEIASVSTSTEEFTLGVQHLDTEEDPLVICTALSRIGDSLYINDAIRAYAYKATESDNFKVRTSAAYAIGGLLNGKDEDAAAKLLEMMQDENTYVVKAAIFGLGVLKKEQALDALTEFLMDDSKADVHYECLVALNNFWYSSVSMPPVETQEKAYRAVMDYYAKKPRTKDIPYWMGLSSFSSECIGYEKWKENATYFDSAEVYTIMADLIADPDAFWMLRTNAIKVVKTQCTADQFKQLKTVVDGLTDDKADSMRSAYNDAAAKD